MRWIWKHLHEQKREWGKKITERKPTTNQKAVVDEITTIFQIQQKPQQQEEEEQQIWICEECGHQNPPNIIECEYCGMKRE